MIDLIPLNGTPTSPASGPTYEAMRNAIGVYRVDSATIERVLFQLLKTYGVSDELEPLIQYQLLCIVLACKFDPVLKKAFKPRRPKMSLSRFVLLEIDIAIERRREGSDERTAIATLCANNPRWKGRDAESLRRQRRRAHSADVVVEITRRAIRGMEARGQLTDQLLADMRTICLEQKVSSTPRRAI